MKLLTAVCPKPVGALDVSDGLLEKRLPDDGLNMLGWLKAPVCPNWEVFWPKPDCAFVGAEVLNRLGWVLPKMFVLNWEDVPWPPNRDVDDPTGCDEELAPNGAGAGVPKIEGAAADDDEEGNAGELKAGAEAPNVFCANGLELGVVLLEKGLAGLADDWPNTFVCVVDELKPGIPVDGGAEACGPPKFELSQGHQSSRIKASRIIKLFNC